MVADMPRIGQSLVLFFCIIGTKIRFLFGNHKCFSYFFSTIINKWVKIPKNRKKSMIFM